MAHPGGRPTDYRPEYCDLLVEFCSRGYTLTSFAAEIGTSRQTLINWADAHPEFFYAVSCAKAVRLRAWEQRAEKAAENGCSGGQATLTVFMLKNHAPDEFKDKQEVGVSGGLTLEQLVAKSITRKDDDTSNG